MPYEQYDRPFRHFPDIETTAQLVVDVSGLRDMAGLDLVAGLDYRPSSMEAIPAQLLRLPIDVSPYAVATKPAAVPSGHLVLWMFAGQRPCGIGFAPWCAGSDSSPKPPDYGCRLEVDIEPGDDRTIAVSGLPKLLPGPGVSYDAYPACPVAGGS